MTLHTLSASGSMRAPVATPLATHVGVAGAMRCYIVSIVDECLCRKAPRCQTSTEAGPRTVCRS